MSNKPIYNESVAIFERNNMLCELHFTIKQQAYEIERLQARITELESNEGIMAFAICQQERDEARQERDALVEMLQEIASGRIGGL